MSLLVASHVLPSLYIDCPNRPHIVNNSFPFDEKDNARLRSHYGRRGYKSCMSIGQNILLHLIYIYIYIYINEMKKLEPKTLHIKKLFVSIKLYKYIFMNVDQLREKHQEQLSIHKQYPSQVPNYI